MKQISWERLAAILVCVVLGGALLYYGARYALALLSPFLVSWLVSLPIRPLVERFSQRLHCPRGVCAAVLLLTVFGLGAWGVIAATLRLTAELGGLVERLLSDGGAFDAMESVMVWMESLGERFGFWQGGEAIREQFYQAAVGMIGDLLSYIASGLPAFVASLFSAFPHVLLFLTVSIIAGFYFCVDGTCISHAVGAILPNGIKQRIPVWKGVWNDLLRKYVKAYGLLLLMTFLLLLVGFLTLGVEYAFLLALLIAAVDLLPVLGVGTVMIPWSIVLLLQKNFYQGFGLLILYLVNTLVRQIAEPRLIGKSLGLHPLLALFATYVGFFFFGLPGMILAPPVAMLVKRVFFGSGEGEVQKKR